MKMDAVELPVFAVSKLLTAEEVEGRERIVASVPVFGASRFAGSSSGKDVKHTVTALEKKSFLRKDVVDVGFCMHKDPLPSFGGETVARQITVKDSNRSLFLLPKCNDKQLQQKGGKPLKSSNLCSKRPRSEQAEASESQVIPNDYNVIYGKHVPSRAECAEKSRVVGQKHNLDGKRGDKRNLRPPSRTKYDSFYSKVGLVSTSPAAAGGNILGIYGLKSDIHDVTKHVDELSLNDLLDGSYKYPSPCTDKAKKTANTNEILCQTIKQALSILQRRRVGQPQHASEEDDNSNRQMDTSGSDSSNRNNNGLDLASSCKDSSSTSSPSALYQPKDILERLTLPPVQDLDNLLTDTSKPAFASRSHSDLRVSKMMSYGASFPPFSWSLSFNGPPKTIIDTGRLSTNRSRWIRIGSVASPLGDVPSCFSDLDLITCDHSKFVKGSPEISLPQRCLDSLLRTPNAEAKLTSHEQGVVLTSHSLDHRRSLEKDDNNIELELSKRSSNDNFASSGHYGGWDQHQWHLETQVSVNLRKAGHSPRLLAAAQILYEMARHTGVQNQNVKLRWPKKLSQKGMKARKSRSSTGERQVMSVTTKTCIGMGDSFEITDPMLPSKKVKVSTINKRKDAIHIDNDLREPLKWSIPASSRSPPIRSEDAESRNLYGIASSSKQILDKGRNGNQKLRKAVVVDWGRGRSKNEE